MFAAIALALSISFTGSPQTKPRHIEEAPQEESVDLIAIAEANGAIWIEGELVPFTLDRETWLQLKYCEYGGRSWHYETTGNGFYGGLQWVLSTWRAYGSDFAATPAKATIGQNIEAGRRVVEASGGRFTAWPGCRAKLGLA
jgi:hypothetical protein